MFALLVLPCIGIGAVIVALISNNGVTVLAILAAAWALTVSLVDARFRLLIAPEQLQITGYLGNSPIIRSSGQIDVNYRRFANTGYQRVEFYHFVIKDSAGGKLRVWRFGWSHRKLLFSALLAWLRANNATFQGESENVMVRLAGLDV
jgi:hypothetical protein